MTFWVCVTGFQILGYFKHENYVAAASLSLQPHPGLLEYDCKEVSNLRPPQSRENFYEGLKNQLIWVDLLLQGCA
jgi:hypothetical protein